MRLPMAVKVSSFMPDLPPMPILFLLVIALSFSLPSLYGPPSAPPAFEIQQASGRPFGNTRNPAEIPEDEL